MKKFIEKNLVIIVLIISLLSLFKSCGDSRELSKVRKEIQIINIILIQALYTLTI
jgi:hypothetical protein